jgi:glycosyltransferase involved in cell wall biosynthesis
MNLYSNINLLVVEDFDFVANGGIENVITSFVPELNVSCGNLIWAISDHKVSLRLDQDLISSSQLVSLKPEPLGPGWITYNLSYIISRLGTPRILRKLQKRLAERAKNLRLKSIIRRYSITHLLNLAIFDQKPPNVSIPTFGIVYDINFESRWHEKCLANLKQWCYFSTGVFTISRWSKQQISDFVIGFNDKIFAVPITISPVNTSQSYIKPPKQNLSCPILLYPASLGPHKNHATLLEALQSLHTKGYEFKLILCGKGTRRLVDESVLDDYKLKAAKSILSASSPDFRSCVEVLGIIEQDHLEKLYKEADLVVLPSTYEGFGLPLSEAVARGVRTICSDIPPFREQIDLYEINQGVRFVKGSSPADWALAIQSELDQPQHMRLAPCDISATLANWGWSDVAKAYLELMLN